MAIAPRPAFIAAIRSRAFTHSTTGFLSLKKRARGAGASPLGADPAARLAIGGSFVESSLLRWGPLAGTVMASNWDPAPVTIGSTGTSSAVEPLHLSRTRRLRL